METRDFDTMARALGRASTRRMALRALAATLVGGGLTVAGVTSASAANRTCRLLAHKCVRDSQCCSGYCERRRGAPSPRKNRCQCPTDMFACAGDCCPDGDTCCAGDCCAAGNICLEDVCCPADTTVVCNGQCCAEGEVCRDGACYMPCTSIAPNAQVCIWDENLDEYHICGNGSGQGPCTTTAECRDRVENILRNECDLPGRICVCTHGFKNPSRRTEMSGYCEIQDGVQSAYGVCPV